MPFIHDNLLGQQKEDINNRQQSAEVMGSLTANASTETMKLYVNRIEIMG